MSSLNPHPELIDGVNVDAVAAAVRGCPGVDDLDAGALGSVSSYLPGRKVPGVRVGTDEVTIQVRGRWAVPVPELARQIRSALATLVGDRMIDIVVADVADAPSDVASALGPQVEPGAAAGKIGPWTASSSDVGPAVPSSAPTTPITAEIPNSSSLA